MADLRIDLVPTNYAPYNGWEHMHPHPDARLINFKGNLQGNATRTAAYNNIRYNWYYADKTGKNVAAFMNTVDFTKTKTLNGQKVWGVDSTGSSFASSDGYFKYTTGGRIDSPTREGGMTVTIYDKKTHYTMMNFCDFAGLIDNETAYLNDSHCNSYLPGVIGFHFRWSWKGSHNSSHCAYPRRVLLLYARETANGSGSADHRIMAIEPASKIGGPNLGNNVTEVPGSNDEYIYNYRLSSTQYDLFKDRLDLSTQLEREKFRFLGPAIEFMYPDKSGSVTMSGTVWDFKPYVAPEYNLSANTYTNQRRYVVAHPANEYRWDEAVNRRDKWLGYTS